MPSREDIQKYTALLGSINALIPVGVQVGFMIADGIKALRSQGDTTTADEAQAALDAFAKSIEAPRSKINNWLATHPPVPE